MLEALLSLLVVLCVLSAVWYGLLQLPLPPPVRALVGVVVTIIGCYAVLRAFHVSLPSW